MSFDYNPYEHIEIIRFDDGVGWYCHSCGGESKEHWAFTTPVAEIMSSYFQHVTNSHQRKPEFFKDWSKY